MIFHTADLHLDHAAIIGFCARPFQTARHMDDVLVANLAARLVADDDLYVVGDFAFGSGPGALAYVRSRFDQIPGRKHLVIGNHDRPWVREDLPWASVAPLVEVAHRGTAVVLRHDPMITWPGARRGALHLFGHAPGNWRGSRNGEKVGADVSGLQPVRLGEAQHRAATLPVNAHWKDVGPRTVRRKRGTAR